MDKDDADEIQVKVIHSLLWPAKVIVMFFKPYLLLVVEVRNTPMYSSHKIDMMP